MFENEQYNIQIVFFKMILVIVWDQVKRKNIGSIEGQLKIIEMYYESDDNGIDDIVVMEIIREESILETLSRQNWYDYIINQMEDRRQE